MKYFLWPLLLLLASCSTQSSSEQTIKQLKPEQDTALQQQTDTIDASLNEEQEKQALALSKASLHTEPFSFVAPFELVRVYNKIPLNRNIHLINTQTAHHVQTSTTAHTTELMEFDGRYYVYTKVAEYYDNHKAGFDLAYVGETFDFAPIETDRVTTLIDSLVNTVDIIQSFGDAFDESGISVNDYTSFITSPPHIQQFSYLGDDCYLINYIFTFDEQQHTAKGMQLLVTPTGSYPISWPCTGKTGLFVLNEKLYIKSHGHCCDCGFSMWVLYEYDSIEFRTVLQDSRWST